MTYAQCERCAKGPSGIDGHTDLFTQSMAGGLVHFRCQACGSDWNRHYAAEGTFSWALPAGEYQGADLPRAHERFATAT